MRRLLLAVLLLVAGCGGGTSETDRLSPLEAVRNAASATDELSSYRTELVTEVDGRVVVRASGEVGVDPPRSRTVTSVPEDVLAEANAQPGAEPVTGDGTVEQRLVDGVLYVTDPASGGWLSYPTTEAELEAAAGSGRDLLTGLAEAGAVERLGRESVRDADTTRYRGRLGSAEASVPVDVWIGDDGLPRRLRFGGSGSETSTLELYDFGVDVDVEAPPADQVRPGEQP